MAGSTRSFRVRARCRERIAFLAAGGADRLDLLGEATATLSAAVGFETAWLGTIDSETGLVTAHVLAYDPSWAAAVPYTLARAIDPDDPLNRAIGPPMQSLSAATDRSLERSAMWTECYGPLGMGDIVRVLQASRQGSWAGLAAFRGREDRPFVDDDLELLVQTAPGFGAILRRAVSQGTVGVAAGANRAAGLLLIDDRLQVAGSTAPAAEWLRLFSDYDLVEPWGHLPAAVYSAVSRARSTAAGIVTPVSSPLLMRDGTWAVVDAASLDLTPSRIAVTIRPASSAETFGAVCRALGLSGREIEIARCVRAGLSTEQIAQRLFLSPHTVKVHVKSVFRKAGVSSRPGLIALLAGTAPKS